MIRNFAPDLVIIDSLRSFNSKMENDSGAAVEQIRRLREISAQCGTCFLLIHHTRKNHTARRVTARASSSLEDSDVMDWLLGTAGSRAIINQTDVRLAFSKRGHNSAELLLRGTLSHRRRGWTVPLCRKRAGSYPESNCGFGYARVISEAALLGNPEQEECFTRLPEDFTTKEARLLYGKSKESSNVWLHKMMRLGLVERTGHGQYHRVVSPPNPAALQ